MVPKEFKHGAICLAVVAAAVILGGCAVIAFCMKPTAFSGIAIVPAGYGVYTFVQKYYPKED